MNLLHDYYIVESMPANDINDGKIFHDALKAAGFKPVYKPVKNVNEFEDALVKFSESSYRYLFISAHGTPEKIALIEENFFAEDLASMKINLKGRRIFLSTCEGGSTLFGRHFIKKNAYSVIGAPDKLAQIVAVGMWTTMVIVFNRSNGETLNFAELNTALKLLVKVYQIELHYYSFRRNHKNKMKEYIYYRDGRRIRTNIDM